MTDKVAIRWDIGDLSESERDRLVEQIVAGEEGDIAVISEIEDVSALREAIETESLSEDPPPSLGPQFIEGADPKLILIVLESCHILIETSKLGTHIKNKLYQKLKDEGETVERVDPSDVDELQKSQ